jgi:phenylalanyl-tRNA synthetase alpha chain
MLDLAPFRPVSDRPAITRDLSIAADADDGIELLGDHVRDALGADGAAVEEVAVLSETPARDLPPAAVRRMGMRPDQKNLLVRVVLRPVDRTLTHAEANRLRDRIYSAIHRGRTHEWATSGGVDG